MTLRPYRDLSLTECSMMNNEYAKLKLHDKKNHNIWIQLVNKNLQTSKHVKNYAETKKKY